MSVGELHDVAVPTVRRWTRDEYYQMGDLGLFREERVQLIDGEIVAMSPQKFPHYAAIDRVVAELKAVFGDECWVRSQAPLTLSEESEPEPDVAVIEGTRDDFTDHPTTALLLVEVSVSSLSFDRNRKASLYAWAGIPENWIVNLQDRQLEVYRDPQVGSGAQSESRYASISSYGEDESVAPIARADVSILVRELLP